MEEEEGVKDQEGILNLEREYAILERECIGRKSREGAFPEPVERARELLLDAQHLLAEYQRERSQREQAVIALQYRGVMDVYNLLQVPSESCKTLAPPESTKKMFIRLYELAKTLGDEETMRFCEDVLETYERHHINDHIEWKR